MAQRVESSAFILRDMSVCNGRSFKKIMKRWVPRKLHWMMLLVTDFTSGNFH